MSKTRKKSVYNDFKTGILSKIFIILGFLILFGYIGLKIINILTNNKQVLQIFANFPYIESLLALAIIFIGVGLMLYFIHSQFAKLADIAEEIEKKHE